LQTFQDLQGSPRVALVERLLEALGGLCRQPQIAEGGAADFAASTVQLGLESEVVLQLAVNGGAAYAGRRRDGNRFPGQVSPRRTEKKMSSTAVRLPYLFVRFITSMLAPVIDLPS
jgi:hypothetical protein